MSDNDEGVETSEFIRRTELANKAFSPSSPITERDLFAGRIEQLGRLVDVIPSRGQHALVYGDRGVGKTSLAKVVMQAGMRSHISAFHTCNSADTFQDIWLNVLEEIRWLTSAQGPGFRPEVEKTVHTATELLSSRQPSPHDVRRVVQALAEDAPVVVFLDEFDRPQDPTTRRLMADLIKMLSDSGIDATLILVGVATSVSDLIAEHLSIGRALAQVQMPLMSSDELAAIVRNGMTKAELEVEDGFVDVVVSLSLGLPHFTHLIAQHGARAAAARTLPVVAKSDTRSAVQSATKDVSQTIRETYHRATSSNRDTMYGDVLLACAMAKKDSLGQFDSRGVRAALQRRLKRTIEIPAFSGHLSAFSDPSHARGGILEKLGSRARYDYRFIDPLMPPYIMMRGHAEDTI
jgi:Cdc6-like AAA superfamily ATPase